MNQYNVVFLMIAAVILAVFLFDRFSGKNILSFVIQWQPVVVALTAFVKAAAGALPSSEFNTVVTILDAASKATQKAEQLYLINELAKDDRNTYAKQLIAETLAEAGITVTEPVSQIIDGCIAAICMLMPHNVTPAVSEGENTTA